ncbi:MAG: hypothetical protein BIFFINMI_01138 [Phycisphaerae bacterium]|nr:hypothetical protein [Phycisphaerae bacterium]
MDRIKTLLAWSCGKDSAWALHVLKDDPGVEVVGLLSTVNAAGGRVAMHRVRAELLDRQADAAGLPLWRAEIPDPCPNSEYERVMAGVVSRAMAAGVEAMAFGDLYLQDVRDYRERNLAAAGMRAVFPLWKRDTRTLAGEMLDGGLRARVVSVDTRQVDASLAGRDWDRALLAGLPPSADPCGENGEFHTFAYAGPMFRELIETAVGELTHGDGFAFVDLRPV